MRIFLGKCERNTSIIRSRHPNVLEITARAASKWAFFQSGGKGSRQGMVRTVEGISLHHGTKM